MKPEQMALMKMEMNLALERFKVIYKKASKGIEKIYTEAVLTNENAKEKWN